MLDIALIRRDPERVRRSAFQRGIDPSFVDDIVRLDNDYRESLLAVETAKAEKNRITAFIGQAADKQAAAAAHRDEIAALSRRIAEHQAHADELSPERPGSPLRDVLENTPNVLDDSVPQGHDESGNQLVHTWGEPPRFDFEPKPHWELGEALGILDFERAAKLSGSRFAVLTGKGARLSRALAQFFLDRASERGYLEVIPPVLVTRDTMWSTGHLSKFADAMFHDRDAGLFLIPTAEVPLTALYRDEILSVSTLPRKLTAHTPCFRKEAGAAGKDTRGLIRQHQFEKVELVWLCAPEDSSNALETLTGDARALLEELELPHRVMSLCAGDTGFNAAKTYDIEVWLPSSRTYREISSCSNCTDFQARRAALRFRRTSQSKAELVHTLNGSGLAIGRTLLAVMENGQRADGSIRIPAALRPYTGFDLIARN
jgi:seryl-tRNA synthetase